MGIIQTTVNAELFSDVRIKFTHSLQTILVAKDVEINHCLFNEDEHFCGNEKCKFCIFSMKSHIFRQFFISKSV